ncbi:MAG: FAD-dependent oxidoreductase [Bacteroidota bacterium]
MQYSFSERWLLQAGVPVENIKTKRLQGLARARRYPMPHRWFYFIFLWITEWLGPLFILFRFSKAGNLSKSTFDIYLKCLREHRISYIQIMGVFVLAPLKEAIIEKEPPKAWKHPLSGLDLGKDIDTEGHSDVIIIGSGAGGAPAALELSRKGMSVTIIEKGDILESGTAPRILEKYYIGQGLTLSYNGGMLLVLAGNTVGGTTSINSGTCLRPLKECLALWDQQLGTHFAEGELDLFMDRVESQIGVCVPSRSLFSKSSELFEKGLNALNRPGAYVLPRYAPECTGSGRCCFGCPTGAKQSTDYSYLPQAVKAGARLLINTKVIKIDERKDKVLVKIKSSEGERLLSCKTLIISGGALFTPGLLKRNRLGSKLSQVGKHLKIHPANKVYAWFPDHFHGEGGIPQGLGYHPPELPFITFEGIHTPKSLTAPILSVSGKAFNWWLERTAYLSSFGLMVRDRGEGSLFELNSFPWIRYKLHPEDAKDMIAGDILIAKAFFAAGAKRVLLPFVGKWKKEFDDPKELEELRPDRMGLKSLVVSGFHPQGTAGMGRVVDADLKLIGSDRIYVCDASVLPDSPGVNPQVTIMALSLRLADKLKLNFQ